MRTHEDFDSVIKRHIPVVLHVDDDPNEAELLRVAARKAGAGWVLRSVGEADEAIQYLEELCKSGATSGNPMPSVIILDLHMPRRTGLDVLGWVRSHQVLRDTPVLVMSGSESEHDRAHAYAAGATSYVVKPLGLEPLVSLMGQIHCKWCMPQLPA